MNCYRLLEAPLRIDGQFQSQKVSVKYHGIIIVIYYATKLGQRAYSENRPIRLLHCPFNSLGSGPEFA